VDVLVDTFIRNSDITVNDIIEDIYYTKLDNGIVGVRLKTVDKYVYIEADISGRTKEGEKGQFIHINPIIWENFDELKTTNTDRYFDHPSYYFLSLFIPIYDDFTYLKDVIALKHEYLITYTPYNLFALKEFEKANLKKID
jgi:hypothetical protein